MEKKPSLNANEAKAATAAKQAAFDAAINAFVADGKHMDIAYDYIRQVSGDLGKNEAIGSLLISFVERSLTKYLQETGLRPSSITFRIEGMRKVFFEEKIQSELAKEGYKITKQKGADWTVSWAD